MQPLEFRLLLKLAVNLNRTKGITYLNMMDVVEENLIISLHH